VRSLRTYQLFDSAPGTSVSDGAAGVRRDLVGLAGSEEAQPKGDFCRPHTVLYSTVQQ